jgi:PAS domain S-box-containing protein
MTAMFERGSQVVLIIDDEKPIRQSIRFYLEDYDYEVLEAENGRIGLERFHAESPDLVIVDLRMPEVDGLEVLSTITEKSPDTPIIVMSGTGLVGDAVEALHRGAWDYLFKPFENLTVLHHAVEKALERTRLLQENREYQEHLEEQVARRTEQLEITSLELRVSEEKYRLLVENQQDMIVKFGLDGRLLFVSPSYCKSFGKTQEELEGESFVALIHEEDRQRVDAAILAVYEPPYTSYVENRAMTVDGIRWQAWQNTAVLDKKNNVTAIMAVGRDVTERKQAEAERERLEMAVEQASEVIIITDTQGTITYVNPAFERVTGYQKEEIIGKNTRLMKSGQQQDDFYRQLWKTISSGKNWTGRFINRKKDGTLYTEDATISPIRSSSGEIVNYVAVKRDITKELKLEAQIQLAKKMEAIASLTGSIAHDFNNLLTVINGHAEITMIKAEKGQDLRKDIQAILQAGERAEHLTRQLLAFSRKQIYKPRVIDINQVLRQMEHILHRLIGEDILLEMHLPDDVPPVEADPGQIEQILTNLVVNARDAIYEKKEDRREKRIIIETARSLLDDSFVTEHPGSRTGLHVYLSINDTGIGMNRETQDKIFEPFFTTKERGKGTGLGMSTVYGFVKQNNGTIYVSSEPGLGTSFTIYWPSTEETRKPEFIAKSDADELTGNETILLVEDEEAVRNFAGATLDELGYRVFKAPNGKKALRLLEENQLTPDLLITDLTMPEMNGRELAKKLKENQPLIKILIASGYSDNLDIYDENIEEEVHLIWKPYSFKTLARKVRKVLDS